VTALLAFGHLSAATAQAGEATYLAPDAGHCAIFRVLSHDLPGECRLSAEAPLGMRTRSIKFHAPEQPAVIPAAATTAPLIETVATVDLDDDDDDEDEEFETVDVADDPERELSLAMRIQFQLNSDVLTEQARSSLDSIAAVLADELMAEKVVMLEGHADATGSDDYNLSLSVRRARAVQSYLVREHGIAGWRLPFTGKGETEPFDQAAPTSSINRRVEFTNITG
jgi:outer membrane protein OmpA-like peptidoglycan-associated protein